jgi:hypothetical protein
MASRKLGGEKKVTQKQWERSLKRIDSAQPVPERRVGETGTRRASDTPVTRNRADAERLVAETKERGGWPYVLALRELNGWISGFYEEAK